MTDLIIELQHWKDARLHNISKILFLTSGGSSRFLKSSKAEFLDVVGTKSKELTDAMLCDVYVVLCYVLSQ